MALTRLPGGMAPWLAAAIRAVRVCPMAGGDNPAAPFGSMADGGNPAVRVCPMAGGGNPAARLAPWLMAAIWAVRAGPVAGRGNPAARCGLARRILLCVNM